MHIKRQAVIGAAAISVISSIIMLLIFWSLPNWRCKPRGFKHILLTATVANLLMAANYFLLPSENAQCHVQAGLQQFFEVTCSWAYTALLAVELAVEIRQKKMLIVEMRSALREPRIAIMHALVLAYASGSTALLFGLGRNGRAGDWCWTPNAKWQLASYSILWLELLLIVASSGVVLCEISHPTEHKYALLRLLAIPVCWMLLHVPGTIRRCHRLLAGNCTWCDNSVMRMLQGICDPSQGTVNLLLFGLTDARLYRELRASCLRTSFRPSNPKPAERAEKPCARAMQLHLRIDEDVIDVPLARSASTSTIRDGSTTKMVECRQFTLVTKEPQCPVGCDHNVDSRPPPAIATSSPLATIPDQRGARHVPTALSTPPDRYAAKPPSGDSFPLSDTYCRTERSSPTSLSIASHSGSPDESASESLRHSSKLAGDISSSV